MNSQLEAYGNSGIDILTGQRFDAQTLKIPMAKQAAERHEAEKRGDQQIEQIIPGVDGGKTEQQSQSDKQTACDGQSQAIGTGMSASSDRITSSLRRCS